MVIITEVDDMALVPARSDPVIVGEGYRGRVLDGRGVSAFRGGQALGDGFFDSVISCYTLLVYHPFALVSLLVGVFIFVAEYHTAHGPLEIAVGSLINFAEHSDAPNFLKTMVWFLVFIFNTLISYKVFVGELCLVWFTYIVKPSSKNLWFSLILSFFMFVKDLAYLEMLILTQSYFLFATLRNPRHKLIMGLIAILILLMSLLDFGVVVQLTGDRFKHQYYQTQQQQQQQHPPPPVQQHPPPPPTVRPAGRPVTRIP